MSSGFFSGPVSGDVLGLSDPLSALTGAVNVPASGIFTTTGALSGCIKMLVPAGQMVVATLTLHVAGAPGMYAFGMVEGTCYTENGDTIMTTGTPFTITVGE
jgi:hypothetical protein